MAGRGGWFGGSLGGPWAESDSVDADDDGYGVDGDTVESCSEPTDDDYALNTDDCDDANNAVFPGAFEDTSDGIDNNCNGQVDEGALNACGNCSPNCAFDGLGTGPFPMPDDNPPNPDVDADGVGLDPNGDLVLDQSNVSFAYMWIANTSDIGWGTVINAPPGIGRLSSRVQELKNHDAG